MNQSLETLRKARAASDINGRERLIEAQNHIIDLLNYMEEREGFTLFQGKRKKCKRIRVLEQHQDLPRQTRRKA